MTWKSAIISAACLLMSAGCSHEKTWKPPSAALFNQSAYNMFSITFEHAPGIALIYAGQLTSAASHNSNSKDKTFVFTGKLTTECKTEYDYRLVSSAVDELTINGVKYSLNNGRIFHLRINGQVLQLPYAPLEPSEEYIKKLVSFDVASTHQEDAEQFLRDLQDEVRDDRRFMVAHMIDYPVKVSVGKHLITLRSEKELLAHYDEIFDERKKRIILNAKPEDLWANSHGVTWKDGTIWFGTKGLRITSINEPLWAERVPNADEKAN
jgi:hypothetical protein